MKKRRKSEKKMTGGQKKVRGLKPKGSGGLKREGLGRVRKKGLHGF